MTTRGTLDALFVPVARAFASVADILAVDDGAALFAELGYRLPNGGNLQTFFAELADKTNELAQMLTVVRNAYQDDSYKQPSFIPKVLELGIAIKNFAGAVSQLPGRANTAFAAAPDFVINGGLDQLPQRLIDYLVVQHLRREHPAVDLFMDLVGLSAQTFVTEGTHNPDFHLIEVRWDRMLLLLTNPSELFVREYAWGTADFDVDVLLDRLEGFLWLVGIPAAGREDLGLGLPIFSATVETPPGGLASAEAGLRLSRADPPATDARDVGLALVPYAEGEIGVEIDLCSGWKLTADAGLAAEGLSIHVRPHSGVELDSNIAAAGRLGVGIVRDGAVAGPIVVFGNSGGTRLEIGQMAVRLQASVDTAGPDTGFEIEFTDMALLLDASDGDGFLQKILPRDPMALNFDVLIGYSVSRGLYIEGGAGLDFTYQINKGMGPFFVSTVGFSVYVNSEDLTLTVAVSGGASIGPVSVSVSEIGLRLIIDFNKPGLLGNSDLVLAFKPPNGLGASMDTGVVRFCGHIEADPPNYAGVLSLSIAEIVDVTAIALVSTQMPDGTEGFSMVLLISSRFQPVQLCFGFALTGVGGLIGIHRALNETALREVFKNRTLDDIFFSDSEIVAAEVPALLDAVSSIFPVCEHRHVIGLMGEIIWGGTLPLATFRFGLLIEFGGDGKIAILGQAKVAVPDEDLPLVLINIDLLGFIDLGNETLAIDSSIYDSRIMSLTISGDLAIRTSWGDDPDFALSIGGFNPRFVPPPGFPALRRLVVEMRRGPASIVFSTYLAVTSNTFQIGARLEAWIDLSVAFVSGGAGFDALIHFKPFEFIVDFYAWFDVEVGGCSIASIDIKLTLSGPNQFHATGYAEVSVLFFSVDVDVDLVFGDKKQEQIQGASPFDLLAAELDDPRNLFTRIPPSHVPMVSLASDTRDLDLFDPSGDLVWEQNSVPVFIELERFAEGQPPVNERFLRVDLNPPDDLGEGVVGQFVRRPFSPVKFRNMTDEEAVAAPAFCDLIAGISWGGRYVSSIHRHHTTGDHETKVYEPMPEGQESEGTDGAAPPFTDEDRAAGRMQAGGIRHRNKRSARNPTHRKYVSVKGVSYTVTTDKVTDGLFKRVAVGQDPAKNMSYMEAADLAKAKGDQGVMVRNSSGAAG